MASGQKEIYYIIAPSYEEAMVSPHLEAFREKGLEVLVVTDELDDLIFGNLDRFKEKKFKSVIKGDIELDKEKKEGRVEATKEFGKLIELLKTRLANRVKDVRLSGRLTSSTCCLVSDEHSLDPSLEKLMKQMGQNVPDGKRILEINPNHKVLTTMQRMFEKSSTDARLDNYIDLLYNQALILDGQKPADPAKFVEMIGSLMVDPESTC